MIHITLSPMRRDDTLNLSRNGDTLTINGTDFDFGPLPDGATLPQEAVDCEWLAGDVERIDGDLHLALILPVGPDSDQAAKFPEPITVTRNGPVDLPGAEIEEPKDDQY